MQTDNQRTQPRQSTGVLNLFCYKCTRMKVLYGVDTLDCQREAIAQGWAPEGARMICPKCPAARRKIRVYEAAAR